MSQILVRNLSPETVEALKDQAKRHKRSLEAEVRAILDAVVLNVAQRGRSPEFLKYEQDLANGRNRNEAFRDYSDAVLAKRPFDPVNSAEDIRAAREEREARFD